MQRKYLFPVNITESYDNEVAKYLENHPDATEEECEKAGLSIFRVDASRVKPVGQMKYCPFEVKATINGKTEWHPVAMFGKDLVVCNKIVTVPEENKSNETIYAPSMSFMSNASTWVEEKKGETGEPITIVQDWGRACQLIAKGFKINAQRIIDTKQITNKNTSIATIAQFTRYLDPVKKDVSVPLDDPLIRVVFDFTRSGGRKNNEPNDPVKTILLDATKRVKKGTPGYAKAMENGAPYELMTYEGKPVTFATLPKVVKAGSIVSLFMNCSQMAVHSMGYSTPCHAVSVIVSPPKRTESFGNYLQFDDEPEESESPKSGKQEETASELENKLSKLEEDEESFE